MGEGRDVPLFVLIGLGFVGADALLHPVLVLGCFYFVRTVVNLS